jgi:hypothetical protein
MSLIDAQPPRLVDLEKAVRQRIVQRTAGRILGLEVDVTAGHVEVRGRAASFHHKQLAIQAVLEEIGAWSNAPKVVIDVQIAVLTTTGSNAVASE